MSLTQIPGLNSQQERNIALAMHAPSYASSPPLVQEALLEAMKVEANFGNPNYGDRDSLGSLQQRAPWGTAASRLNVTQSAERFLQKANKLYKSGNYHDAGALAQGVQVSAFPSRYGAQKSVADSILTATGGHIPDVPGGSSDTGSGGGGSGIPVIGGLVDWTKKLAHILSALSDPKFWYRILLMLAGLVLIYLGLRKFDIIPQAVPVPVPV